MWTACKNDSQDTNYEELILGRWEIKEAIRNGRPTETLTGAYMEFLPKGKMISNLGGAPEESEFILEGNILTSRSMRMPADYTIQYVGDSTMVLNSVIQEIPFQFTLARPAGQPVQE